MAKADGEFTEGERAIMERMAETSAWKAAETVEARGSAKIDALREEIKEFAKAQKTLVDEAIKFHNSDCWLKRNFARVVGAAVGFGTVAGFLVKLAWDALTKVSKP